MKKILSCTVILPRCYYAFGIATVCLIPALTAEAYDFNSYTPTLDRHHALPAASSDYSPIDSGYRLKFNPGTADDYDFISYDVGKDNNVIPVYHKIAYSYDGGGTDAAELSRINTDQEGKAVTGYFHDLSTASYQQPAAIYNTQDRKIGVITADFINNTTNATNWNAFGGAITNGGLSAGLKSGTIEKIRGDFIGNSANGIQPKYQAAGGAIVNISTITPAIIKTVEGNFINNSAQGVTALGGAVTNSGTIGTIDGVFINNSVNGSSAARAGAIYISTTKYENGDLVNDDIPEVPLIKGTFIGNHADSYSSAYGGAISNSTANGITPDIHADFIGNYAVSSSSARGGAIDALTGLNTVTGNFIGNYAKSLKGNAYAGAIYIGNSTRFVAAGQNNYFIGNYTSDKRGKIYNAFFVQSKNDVTLTFDINNGGNLYFNDNFAALAGETNTYNLNILGYGTGKFMMNNYIMNAGEVDVDNAMLVFNQAPYKDDDGCGEACRGQFIAGFEADGKTPDLKLAPVTSLSLNNSQFYLHNNYIETVRLKNYTVSGNSLLHIDVSKQNGDWVADKISLSGQIEGATQVVVYDKTNEDNRNASVLFIEAPNDIKQEGTQPGVFRVYGSPYKWDIAYNYRGETSGSYWYLIGTDKPNDDVYIGFVPDPVDIDDPFDLPEPEPKPDPKPEVTPEVIAYQGLSAASLEQTRSMVGNIRDKVAANKVSVGPCGGIYDEAWNGEPLNNIWVTPAYHTATIDSPVKTDVDIWGLEAGFDVQRNINHKLGVFASYRQGDYELDGSGDKFFSYIGADIDIDSYMAGLYYRYDYRRFWIFGTVYGGLQQADIKSKDGVTGSSDGIELGGSLEAGYLYDINDTLKLEPSIGVAYTQVEFDDIRDNYGKTAAYDTIRETELSAGIKLEKYMPTENGIAKLYVKPSVIQVLNGDNRVVISGLKKSGAMDDATLGRMELGGRYGFDDHLSAYGWTNYTFGSDYDAFSVGAGISYAW